MLTLRDVMDRLKQQPELDVLDVLEITSEDIVERFEDKVELKYNQLLSELEDEEEDN